MLLLPSSSPYTNEPWAVTLTIALDETVLTDESLERCFVPASFARTLIPRQRVLGGHIPRGRLNELFTNVSAEPTTSIKCGEVPMADVAVSTPMGLTR